MIPIIPTLALALVSFICSAFVILRITIPLLPPRQSGRLALSLYDFRSLSPADQSHIWLATLDIISLAMFIWQATTEDFVEPKNLSDAQNPAASVRLWIALTLRQTCLLVVASLTLFHIRMGSSVSFGSKHWALWAPTAILVGTGATMAEVLTRVHVTSLFSGIIAYNTSVAVFSTIAFGYLIGTLIIIRRNFTLFNKPTDARTPSVGDRQPCLSFLAQDVEALKDGSSWLTSNASTHGSISPFSFSTFNSAIPSTHGSISATHPATSSFPSISAKSSVWFSTLSHPIPPVPACHRSTNAYMADCTGRSLAETQISHIGGQSSWVTENSTSQATLSAWSYPTTLSHGHGEKSNDNVDTNTFLMSYRYAPFSPAPLDAHMLGGYGHTPSPATFRNAEKTLSALPDAHSKDLDVSVYRSVSWLVTIWVPLAFSLPYLVMAVLDTYIHPAATSILLALSVTMSSPLMACNILLRSPLPISSGLFDVYSEPPSLVMRPPSPQPSIPAGSRYKSSGSLTVVEGRPSGDIWISNGDAVEKKSWVNRALGLLSPAPKLSVLPGYNLQEEGQSTPPVLNQTELQWSIIAPTSLLLNSVELEQRELEGIDNTFLSSVEGSPRSTHIITDQFHYSTLDDAAVLHPPSRENASPKASAITPTTAHTKTRFRSHSTSSINELKRIGPLSLVVPPPSNKQNRYRRCASTGAPSGIIENTDIIDNLLPRTLPLFVPDLNLDVFTLSPDAVGLLSGWVTPRSSVTTSTAALECGPVALNTAVATFVSFNSPEAQSTPRESKRSTAGRHILGNAHATSIANVVPYTRRRSNTVNSKLDESTPDSSPSGLVSSRHAWGLAPGANEFGGKADVFRLV